MTTHQMPVQATADPSEGFTYFRRTREFMVRGRAGNRPVAVAGRPVVMRIDAHAMATSLGQVPALDMSDDEWRSLMGTVAMLRRLGDGKAKP